MNFKLLLIFYLGIFISGCASTKVTGFSDPAYKIESYQSIVIFASNVGLEQASELEGAMCEKFQENSVKCSPFLLLFPPTRQYTAQAVYEVLQQNGFESILVLSTGGDYSSSEVFGYQSYGSATANSNTAQGQSSTYALRSYSRQSKMRIVLIDSSSGETAWIGDAKTEGKGALSVTDSAFMSSLTSKVVSTLLESSHFKPE